MSLFGRQSRDFTGVTADQLVPSRASGRIGTAVVNSDTAMRHSAVWACIRLRANLISTFPLDVYRKVGDLAVEMSKPPVLVNPGGEHWDYCDWMYATQADLDRAGNTIGIITETNSLGLPARIDLQPIGLCSVIQKRDSDVLVYRIDGKEYPSSRIWHERQYVVAGLAVGLSPIAYAAWSIGEYLSQQQFALDWFGGGAVPKARMKNTARTMTPTEIEVVKNTYRASVESGGLFVHGADWEYDMMQAESMGSEWLEGRRFSLADVARFFDCPADLIDAAVSTGGSLTYANISQRNLQLLIMSLGPAIYRREKNLSKLLPAPRYVKLNTDALLRMDAETRSRVIDMRIKSRTLTVTEARALENYPPLTEEQMAEFDRLFGSPRTTPTASAASAQLLDEAPIRAVATVGRHAAIEAEPLDVEEMSWQSQAT